MNKDTFNYKLVDLHVYADELAHFFNEKIENDSINYPLHIADGNSKFFRINDYISFQIVDYHTKQQIIFNRAFYETEGFSITISFHEFTFTSANLSANDESELILDNHGLGSIVCKSANSAEIMNVAKNVDVNVLFILLKEGWIEHTLHSNSNKEKVASIFKKENLVIRKEFLGFKQIEIFREIFQKSKVRAVSDMFYTGRVMQLLEDFLTEVLDNECLDSHSFAKAEDIRRVQIAEKYISNNFDKSFVGVEELSKMCFMSRTKFINLFQKIYGSSSFEYYQRKRLNLSYEILKNGESSIGKVAESVGYTSVNNFNIAFEKAFGKKPKELLVFKN